MIEILYFQIKFFFLFFLGILFILGEQFGTKLAIFRCTPAYI